MTKKNSLPSSDISLAPGILPVHKSVGPTSRTVVDYFVDKIKNHRKVGHGGTLDPKAEGVIPLLVGEATKLTPYLQKQSKTYYVRCRFDYQSDTLDTGNSHSKILPSKRPGIRQIKSKLNNYIGKIKQSPPRYSAIKKNGKRLYKLAREGNNVSPDLRTVHSNNIKISRYKFPVLELEVSCGKGFYIRSLIRDLSDDLNQEGGIVTVLIRTQYGPFQLSETANLLTNKNLSQYYISPSASLTQMEQIQCTDDQIQKLTYGNRIQRQKKDVEYAQAVSQNGLLHAIVESRTKNNEKYWKPARVLNRNTPHNML